MYKRFIRLKHRKIPLNKKVNRLMNLMKYWEKISKCGGVNDEHILTIIPFYAKQWGSRKIRAFNVGSRHVPLHQSSTETLTLHIPVKSSWRKVQKELSRWCLLIGLPCRYYKWAWMNFYRLRKRTMEIFLFEEGDVWVMKVIWRNIAIVDWEREDADRCSKFRLDD